MKKDYYKEGADFIRSAIENFAGDRVEGYGHEEPYESEYLGSVPCIMPSGKYYTPWACGNLDPCPHCGGTGELKRRKVSAKARERAHRMANRLRDFAIAAYGFYFEGRWPEKLVARIEKHDAVRERNTERRQCPHCGGCGSQEAHRDDAFREGMEAAASEAGYWIESGEGDPLDMFLCRPAPEKETEDDE